MDFGGKMTSSSLLQETEHNKVSQTIFSKTIFAETQAGTTTYPIRVSACTIQGAEIDLSVMDGKHNRTGRRQARSSVIPTKRESERHVGSNPAHPIGIRSSNGRASHLQCEGSGLRNDISHEPRFEKRGMDEHIEGDPLNLSFYSC
jgi:hypothetical protein